MRTMRGPTSAPLPGCVLALLLVTTPPVTGQQPTAEPADGEVGTLEQMTEEELSAEGFVDGSYVIRDLPYAMSINALFGAMVHWQAIDSWWRNHGLDPESAAVKELQALAAELERAHPALERLVPSDDARPGEIEAANVANRALRDARYRALGAAFGQWLENRRAEGYPPELFLDRLVSGFGGAAFSDESMEDVRAEVTRNAAEFEAGLRQSMETVPPRLTAAGWEED